MDRILVGNAVHLGEEEVGSVGTSLIPSLDGGANCAGNDRHVQLEWQTPPVGQLHPDYLLLFLAELLFTAKVLVVVGILGQDSTLSKDRKLVYQTLFLGEDLDIPQQLLSWNSLQRVLDLGFQITVDVNALSAGEATLELLDTFLVAIVAV